MRDLQQLIGGWTPQDHLDLYRETGALMDELDPVAVVLDPIFMPAIEATMDRNRLYAIVTMQPLLDSFGEVQPWGKILWKFPA